MGGGVPPPPFYDFFNPNPLKPMPPPHAPLNLKMKPPLPHLKNEPPSPLKKEVSFQIIIPRKKTLKNETLSLLLGFQS